MSTFLIACVVAMAMFAALGIAWKLKDREP